MIEMVLTRFVAQQMFYVMKLDSRKNAWALSDGITSLDDIDRTWGNIIPKDEMIFEQKIEAIFRSIRLFFFDSFGRIPMQQEVRADQLLQGGRRHQDDGVISRRGHSQDGSLSVSPGPLILQRQGGGSLHPPGGRRTGGWVLASAGSE